MWKIVRGLVPNLSDPITWSLSDRRGRTCIVYHAGVVRVDTLKYNSFRWRSTRMINRLPKCIHMLCSCSVIIFNSELDSNLNVPCGSGAFSLEEGRIDPLPLPRHVVRGDYLECLAM